MRQAQPPEGVTGRCAALRAALNLSNAQKTVSIHDTELTRSRIPQCDQSLIQERFYDFGDYQADGCACGRTRGPIAPQMWASHSLTPFAPSSLPFLSEAFLDQHIAETFAIAGDDPQLATILILISINLLQAEPACVQ